MNIHEGGIRPARQHGESEIQHRHPYENENRRYHQENVTPSGGYSR